MPDSQTESLSSGATSIVYVHTVRDTTPDDGSYGLTTKGLMAWAGSMMSRGGKWLETERSYEITGVSILLSFLFVGVFMGFSLGHKYGISRTDMFKFDNKNLQMVAIAQVPGEKDLFIPVYKEVQK